jgi:hypothetical protein
MRLACALGVALVALAGAGPASAAGSKTFTDPTGDGGATPDITTVVVSNDDSGLVSFAITFANPALLTGSNFVLVFLNTDRNIGTGRAGDGSEYAIYVDATSQVFARWNGTMFAQQASTTFTRTGASTLGINKTDIGGVNAFNFYLIAGGASVTGDTAPDGAGVWSFDLQARPQLQAISARFTPAVPRAGKVFAITGAVVRLQGGKQVRPSSFACRAKLGGRALAASGRCRWVMPRNAKGRKLAITITATYQGVSASFQAYSFTVR